MSVANQDSAEPVASENIKPPPPWLEWCLRNSKPVKRNLPKVVREPTPWQKPGPMKRRDWKAFFEWASRNALPPLPRVTPKRTVPCPAEYLPCAQPKRKFDLNELLPKFTQLSTPLERLRNKKYVFKKEHFAYSPAIVYGKPARQDKSRPFEPVYKPCCFPNADVENDFWSRVRFPVRRAALRFRPSARILTLAKPRPAVQFPPHCVHTIPPVGALDGKPPKRKKFTARGWRLHQIRLIYLSKPVCRPEYEYFYL